MAKPQNDLDELFKLPLADFISARRTLASRLKKRGEPDEAKRVQALAKPSISAWTVNQLYWTQREAFDELVATGQRLRKAQVSGKMVNIREALDARREALSHLSDLATEVLQDGGHHPSLDTLRRITSTLEALSASTSPSDGPTPGRLTHDVDPPGFDSFGSFVPSAVTTKRASKPQPVAAAKRAEPAPSKSQQKTAAAPDAGRREARQARINAAKTSLQNAKRALTAAQAQAKSLEAARKRAEAGAREAEKQTRQAEERFKKASVAAESAAQRAQSIAVEMSEATDALDKAKRTVEIATRELETAFRELPGSGRAR